MKSILIIDDDFEIDEKLGLALRNENYQVRFASSGAIGLKMLSAEPAQLILLDWRMPQMGGEQVLAELSGNPMLKKIPIILMSANINHIPEECLRFKEHIPKPCDPDHLLKLISKIFHTYSKAPRRKGEL